MFERCLPEILTLTIKSPVMNESFCQAAIWRQVSLKIQLVIGMIKPVFSAIGINLAGEMSPSL